MAVGAKHLAKELSWGLFVSFVSLFLAGRFSPFVKTWARALYSANSVVVARRALFFLI